MIPFQELRIGNYILQDDLIRQVAGIHGNGSLMGASSLTAEGASTDEAADFSTDRIQPVLLTVEILERCGFVYQDYFKFWQLIRTLPKDRSEMNIDLEYNIIDFMRRPVVKVVTSLHRLQNIYYALKGHELQFNQQRQSPPVPAVAGKATIMA